MIDKEFDDLAENYAKNLEKLRREAEEMRARASDPDFMSFMNAAAKERGRDFAEANLEAMAAFLERRGHGSLDELRDRVQARNLWRELTAAVTGDEFLSDWRRRRMSSHLG